MRFFLLTTHTDGWPLHSLQSSMLPQPANPAQMRQVTVDSSKSIQHAGQVRLLCAPSVLPLNASTSIMRVHQQSTSMQQPELQHPPMQKNCGRLSLPSLRAPVDFLQASNGRTAQATAKTVAGDDIWSRPEAAALFTNHLKSTITELQDRVEALEGGHAAAELHWRICIVWIGGIGPCCHGTASCSWVRHYRRGWDSG